MLCPRCSGTIPDNVPACPTCGLAVAAPGPGALSASVDDADLYDGDETAAERLDRLAREQLADAFHIDVLLGHGESSAVFLAREPGAEAHVVLKVLPRLGTLDLRPDERFRRAATQVATLDHPNLVTPRHSGLTADTYWYTTPSPRARPLRALLREDGPFEPKACLRLAAQVLAAVEYLHRQGVVHGGVRPENVLVESNGWVHVTDALIPLEVARARLEAEARQGRRSGTAAPPVPDRFGPSARTPYDAPEVRSAAEASIASDQFALAVLFHECLTGRVPAPHDETRLILAQRGVPAHFTHALVRALSPDPLDRFPGVHQFALALESSARSLDEARPTGRMTGQPLIVQGWHPPTVPRTRPWRRLALRTTGAVVTIGAVTAAVLLLSETPLSDRWTQRQPRTPGWSRADTTSRDSAGAWPFGDTVAVDSTPRRTR